ncbi:carbohydrate kinase [Aurantimonas sp. A2-1-M11]|uniref:carbohydrate kinase family protein n=1 Tax=Aurantimonas sp. A2-1-M11 TaxID=3113712 RepID=UPI002F94BF46
MFLSCGDALFDLFVETGDDVAQIALAGRVGGSPLNVALGLARLGHPAGFFTKVSRDVFGSRIRGFMARESIDQRFLIPTDRNTTLAMVSLGADGSPAYAFYIDGTADRSIEPSDVPDAFPEELAAIHLASYSTVTEPTASALMRLVRQEAERRFVSYDPNIRTAIEPDIAIWRDKVAELVPFAALVKASEEDLEQLYPGQDVEAVLADWVGAGADMAVVTRGEKGAVALTAGGVTASVDGRRIAVADTVGAGDTFQAALLAALKERGHLSRPALRQAERATVESLLAFAVAAAAITCSRRGADLPRRADLILPPLA